MLRFALRDLLLSLRSVGYHQMVRLHGRRRGRRSIAAALRLAGNHQIITFIDDSPVLWQRTINGIPIQPPQVLSEICDQLDQVLLAIPSLPRSDRRRIVSDLQNQEISVLQVPSVDDLTSGRARIESLRPVAIEELLGRDTVPPLPEHRGPAWNGAVVSLVLVVPSVQSFAGKFSAFPPGNCSLLKIVNLRYMPLSKS